MPNSSPIGLLGVIGGLSAALNQRNALATRMTATRRIATTGKRDENLTLLILLLEPILPVNYQVITYKSDCIYYMEADTA